MIVEFDQLLRRFEVKGQPQYWLSWDLSIIPHFWQGGCGIHVPLAGYGRTHFCRQMEARSHIPS